MTFPTAVSAAASGASQMDARGGFAQDPALAPLAPKGPPRESGAAQTLPVMPPLGTMQNGIHLTHFSADNGDAQKTRLIPWDHQIRANSYTPQGCKLGYYPPAPNRVCPESLEAHAKAVYEQTGEIPAHFQGEEFQLSNHKNILDTHPSYQRNNQVATPDSAVPPPVTTVVARAAGATAPNNLRRRPNFLPRLPTHHSTDASSVGTPSESSLDSSEQEGHFEHSSTQGSQMSRKRNVDSILDTVEEEPRPAAAVTQRVEAEAIARAPDAANTIQRLLQERQQLRQTIKNVKTEMAKDVDEGEKQRIKIFIRDRVYRDVKFLPKDNPNTVPDKQIAHVSVVYIYRLMYAAPNAPYKKKLPKEDAEKQRHKEAWVATYKKPIATMLNAMRSDKGGNLRTSILKVLMGKWQPRQREKMFDTEVLLAVVTRDFETVEKEVDGKVLSFVDETKIEGLVAMHYYADLVSKVVGNGEFPVSKKGYERLLEVKCKKYPQLQLMTPSTEAFIYILYDNMVEVYQSQINYFKQQGQWFANLPNRKDNKEHAVYADGKYTKRKQGTEKFGTFSAAGYKEWSRVRALIKQRRSNHPKEVERCDKAMMNSYRLKNNITASCHEAQLKKNNQITVVEDLDLEQIVDDDWLGELTAEV